MLVLFITTCRIIYNKHFSPFFSLAVVFLNQPVILISFFVFYPIFDLCNVRILSRKPLSMERCITFFQCNGKKWSVEAGRISIDMSFELTTCLRAIDTTSTRPMSETQSKCKCLYIKIPFSLQSSMSSYIQLNALKCIVNIAAIPFSPNIYACALYEIPIYQNPMSMVFKIIWLYTISGYFGDILVGLLLAHRHGAFCCQSGFIQMQWRKLTFEVCVLRLDSVAKPLPHILQ